MNDLYRIDQEKLDYLYPSYAIHQLIDEMKARAVLIPVTIDYEAATEKARTYLSHHASYEEQIRQAVDAALGGQDE